MTPIHEKGFKVVSNVNWKNENHLLWNNRGIYWMFIQVEWADSTSQRLRFSLRTTKLEEARKRRDAIMDSFVDSTWSKVCKYPKKKKRISKKG